MSVKELLKNTEIVIGEEEFSEKVSNGEKLKIKFGVDPTRPDLTFGHLVVFNKLKQFQDEGHEAILLIGDYTARIGDPSGRSDLRPELTEEEVNENAKTYLEQAFRIIDPEKTTVRRNSEWFSKMNFADSLALSRKMTVARMLERDDFEKRFKNNQPISMVEFMYPLIQGYDSIVLESDVEIGGSDQLFNMLVGRTLQKDEGAEPQTVLTMPLLVGLDGTKKMSKSYNNYIAFNDSPKDIFGKTMSISDDTMWDYYKLLLLRDKDAILDLKKNHPMEMKKELARELTALFYDLETAENEKQSFSQVFTQRENPEEMDSYSIAKILAPEDSPNVLNILAKSMIFESKGQIRRLIKQGAIKINGQKVESSEDIINLGNTESGVVVKAGKKIFFKVVG
ncbi:MAG: tyrosine--tRNA ligase [Opitutales bacterium]|jgi:tyrosyl-tRNA synthetase|tara:strand:+ start:396 stop:1580 length:1185 start_codon:yes stop_codon:yes gene_type:complete